MVTQEKLIETMVAAGVELEANNISLEASFEDLGLDSLDVFNFFSEIDAALGVEIPDADFDSLNSLGSVLNYLNK